MTNPIRWGILSTAGIGRKRVIPAMKLARNGVVAAVASRSLEKAQTFAAEMGIPKAYGSYEELIADPEIDAIYNPLPNSEHAQWSIRCAEAGKPVLCEKPLASDANEAQRMVEAFTSRGIPFAEGFMYRFHPQAQKVKALIDEGAIGRLNTLNATFSFNIANADNIRLRKDLAGGALMDVGCYCVNLMRFMTGEEPQQAKALAVFGETTGVDERLVGLLAFPSGALGHFDCGLRQQWLHTYELRGTEGRLLVEKGFTLQPHEEGFIRWWRGDDYQEIRLPAVNHYTLMAEDFADALLHQRPPRFPAEDGVATMRVIDRLLADAR